MTPNFSAELNFGYEEEVEEKLSADENQNNYLFQEIRSVLQEELKSSKNWSIFHIIGFFIFVTFANFFGFLKLFPALGLFFALFFAFHFGMITVYFERQCNLKSKIQNLFGLHGKHG